MGYWPFAWWLTCFAPWDHVRSSCRNIRTSLRAHGSTTLAPFISSTPLQVSCVAYPHSLMACLRPAVHTPYHACMAQSRPYSYENIVECDSHEPFWLVHITTHPIATVVENILSEPWPAAEEQGLEVPAMMKHGGCEM
jgi:hypothetical protein